MSNQQGFGELCRPNVSLRAAEEFPLLLMLFRAQLAALLPIRTTSGRHFPGDVRLN